MARAGNAARGNRALTHRTPLKKLSPIIDIAGKRYALYTQLILSVPVSALRHHVTNIADRRDDITAALDMLFQGF